MQNTEHYGLNLWELSDRIRMEDFNADNQKLDAALSLLAAGGGGVEELEPYASSQAPVFSMGLVFWRNDPKPRWDEFSLIILTVSVTDPAAGGIPFALLSPMPYSMTGAVAKYSFSPGGCIYVLTPFKDGSRRVQGFVIANGNCQIFREDITFNDLASFWGRCETSSGTGVSALIHNMRAIGIR